MSLINGNDNYYQKILGVEVNGVGLKTATIDISLNIQNSDNLTLVNGSYTTDKY
ncbi:hypothetical protein [Yersinia sp. Marseille-Q3913]|uniref:hypothetical protein n=1 Tax=Yersinia sp. Marseille-Q3913 TaxID=2830769 RepID=UPI001BAF0216|nr:hypothetical protein [Yersinia sp. Marseille-Q3913]MBS0057757.1 hypothetical protein [Yersinia sp. Marseille-Q3913]